MSINRFAFFYAHLRNEMSLDVVAGYVLVRVSITPWALKTSVLCPLVCQTINKIDDIREAALIAGRL